MDHAQSPGTGLLDSADQLGDELLRLSRLMERTAAQLAAQRGDGVERASYQLLVNLVREGPQRTSTLAEAVHSDPSTVSRQAASLVHLGLLERRPDPEDGRACLLAATPEGERVHAERRRRRNEHLAAMTRDWPEADRRMFVTLLERFNNDFAHHRPHILAEDAR
ncbi:MAG: MarR family winged helix-turn-helix transcriptional regulator [Pseudonocardiaceae bacterium]